jgi:predicted lipid-binding transport protein (Tim44 family)
VSSFRWVQTITRLAALAAVLLIGADDADMRLVDALGFGAGGSGAPLSFVSAAAAETAITRHAPAQAAPQTYPGGSLNGLFKGGGLLGGFAAGFIGSGLLGLLFGRGLFGELDGVASYFGLLCQLALLVLLCWLIWTRWRSADAAGIAARSPRQLADAYLRSRDELHAGSDASAGADSAIEARAEEKPLSPRSAVTDAGGEQE